VTIYVSIAAYRDPQLVPTIEDCLAKARHPEQLRFGICWQHGPEETALPWAGDPRFRIMDVDWKASRGACWARAELMNRYDGEDYFLQLDSHHRFAQDWDVKALEQMRRTGSPKPVLTAYATPFNPDKPDERTDEPMRMNFDRFTDESIILFRPGGIDNWQARERPVRGRFLSAHFLFAEGRFVRDVPYDPELYFIGEEITLTVRAFTHGYDIFHPTEVIVWHEYTREYREHKHWTDHNHDKGVEVAWHQRDKVSLEKVKAFLRAPWIGAYGLGTERTFAEYEAYAGVNFQLRRAQEYTRRFEEPPNPPADPDWAGRIATYSLDLAIEKSRLPQGLDDYQFWYVGVHDKDSNEILRQDADRDEVLKLLADPSPVALLHRSFDTEKVPASWTVWPVSESRGWLERIDGPILPEHRPITLVTALLDIGREQLGRSFTGHYLHWLEELLQNDLPMVVYIEPEHEEFVWRHREPYNTKVVALRKADLEALPWFDTVQRIRQSSEWREQAGWLPSSPQAALAHYNPLVMSKMRWLADVARDNPFRSAGVYWVDAGLRSTVSADLLFAPVMPARLLEAAPDFLWLEFPYRSAEIHGFPRRELAQFAGVGSVDRVVRGGFFGGAPERVTEVAALYEELLETTLETGFMGTEESLFTILAYRHPRRFSHYLIEPNGHLYPFFEDLVRGKASQRLKPPAREPITALVPSTAAAPLTADEEEQRRRGLTWFMGVGMMQNQEALRAFNALWRRLERDGQRVARIIEIGTGPGGLSALLQLYCASAGASFITYDHWEHSGREAVFDRMGIDLRIRDLSHEFVRGEIAREVQQPGLSILLCDGGDKVEEVRTFAPFLKPGDLILAHDYATSTAEFDTRIRDRFWSCCEITDAEIASTIRSCALEPVLSEVFAPAAWMCSVKRSEVVVQAPAAQGSGGGFAVYVLTFNAPEQLASWFASVEAVEPALLTRSRTRVVLNNSTDESTFSAYEQMCSRYGFEHVRLGNLGILGGRAWCARHFDEHSADDFMLFFEDDMQLHAADGHCRNGMPTRVPGFLQKALDIVRNEPGLDYLKLSYSEFYGDHRENWASRNLPEAEREKWFPAGTATRVEAIRSHGGLAYAVGEIFYSNWPMIVTRAGNRKLFLDHPAATAYEQTLMVRALELQRQGTLRAAVVLASLINHNREVHYPAELRKES
jgi:hypothetical protein